MLLAVSAPALLGACGGSSTDAGKTATAQPSTAPVGSGAPAAETSKAAAAPITVPVANAQPGRQTGTAPARSAPSTSAPPPTLASTLATTTTASPKLTTKTWAPTSPQSSASLAGWALLDAWVADNRSRALQDASPAAVSALFSYTYPQAGVQFRGCSSPPGNTASNCVYRDGNDLLSLAVSLYPRGWAVTGAVLES